MLDERRATGTSAVGHPLEPPTSGMGPEARLHLAAASSPLPAAVLSIDRVEPRLLWQRAAKRTLDVAIVLILSPIVAALVLLAAILIVVIDRQSPFFGDRRVGRDGRIFRCFKLRTLRGGDADLSRYLRENPAEARHWVESRKLDHDPRVTRVGALLRGTSLDELPQFLNVLLGTMSLVGPRPLSEREFLARPAASRLMLASVRPGITGLWQVNGRSATTLTERIRLDDEYALHWSLRGDVRIVLRTPSAVLSRDGAR